MLTSTLYTSIPQTLFNQFKQIKLLACDVDGVFSDGRIYLGNGEEELKAFHTKDGFGLKAIMRAGIDVVVITGRQSNIVQNRMQNLGVKHIIQGCENKYQSLTSLQQQLGIDVRQTAAIGDDVPDLGMFECSALRIAVADAHPLLVKQANYICQTRGGFGAVREICDIVLQANNRLDDHRGGSL